jgi:hypothetical protein
MADERMDEAVVELARSYNAPPPTPRDEMWKALEERLGRTEGDVIPLARARRVPVAFHRLAGWGVAAAALLVMGIGIGRMTVPHGGGVLLASPSERSELLRTVALEHLGRSESLLTLVRADARAGRMDPHALGLARDLLTETRLILDAPDERDPSMRGLLEDLEFVLMQVVGAEESEVKGRHDAGAELSLALRGMDERAVLPRIQAVVPPGTGRSGT